MAGKKTGMWWLALISWLTSDKKYLLTIETNERCLPHKECIHKSLNNSYFKQGTEIELETFVFRIEFSDGSEIQMMKLLEPILLEEKFKSIPKMVITQFCRGQSMQSTAFADSSDLAKEVNGQEFFFKITITITV